MTLETQYKSVQGVLYLRVDWWIHLFEFAFAQAKQLLFFLHILDFFLHFGCLLFSLAAMICVCFHLSMQWHIFISNTKRKNTCRKEHWNLSYHIQIKKVPIWNDRKSNESYLIQITTSIFFIWSWWFILSR